MRQLLLSFSCVLFMTGLVIAAEGTLVNHDGDKKEVTVKDAEGKEIVLKYNDKTKVTFLDKDGNASEGTLEAAKKVWSNDKAKGKLKMEYTADKEGLLESVKMRGRKKN